MVNYIKATCRICGLLLLAMCCMAGCTNGFAEFYQGARFKSVSGCEVVTKQPEGTHLIGESHFVDVQGQGSSEALSAARSVGADYIKWTAEYAGTTQSTGVLPITTPTTSTTYYNGNTSGSVYNQYGGYVGGYDGMSYGSSTTYGSQTNFIPYTKIIHWMRYAAWFYRSNELDDN